MGKKSRKKKLRYLQKKNLNHVEHNKDKKQAQVSKLSYILLFLLFIVGSFILYHKVIYASFVYDDKFFYIRKELRDISYIPKLFTEGYLPQNLASGTYRPLPVISFALNFILFGESSVSFHLINIILHGLVSFMVTVVALKLFNNKFVAIISGILFLSFPIHTEAVAFVKSRDELLGAFFVLLSWNYYLKAVNHKGISYNNIGLSMAFYFLAILSKEFIFVAPAAFIYASYINNKQLLKKLIQAGLGYFLVFILYMGIRVYVLGKYAFGAETKDYVINPLINSPYWNQLWTGMKMLFMSVYKTFIPIDFSATYSYNHIPIIRNPIYDWQSLMGVLVIALVLIFVFNQKLRKQPLAIGFITFFVLYLTYSKLIFNVGEYYAERWIYIPSIGLAIFAASIVYIIYKKSRSVGAVFLISIIIVYISATILRSFVWQNRLNFYQNMVIDAPNSVQALTSLSLFYVEKYYDLEGAERLIDKALLIYPNYYKSNHIKGSIVLYREDKEVARKYIERSLDLKPGFPEGLYSLARLLTLEGKYQESNHVIIENNLLEKIAAPSHVHNSIAKNYYHIGDYEKAKEYAEKVNE